MFEKTKELLDEWLDHAQRSSTYRAEAQYDEAMDELKEVITNEHRSLETPK